MAAQRRRSLNALRTDLCVYRMLEYLVIILLAVGSRSLGLNCIRDFDDAEEAIVNGSLGPLLSSLSNAFYPTSEMHTEYLTIRYLYALNCTDGGLNHSLVTDYIWASSSVYLVVEPDALEDLTCGIVDVTWGSLPINLQCLCPTYPDDVTSILRRLTAYVSQYIKLECDLIANLQFFNFEDSQNLLQMPDQPEICRICKVTIPLLFLHISAVPIRFYESLNENSAHFPKSGLHRILGTVSRFILINCICIIPFLFLKQSVDFVVKKHRSAEQFLISNNNNCHVQGYLADRKQGIDKCWPKIDSFLTALVG